MHGDIFLILQDIKQNTWLPSWNLSDIWSASIDCLLSIKFSDPHPNIAYTNVFKNSNHVFYDV